MEHKRTFYLGKIKSFKVQNFKIYSKAPAKDLMSYYKPTIEYLNQAIIWIIPGRCIKSALTTSLMNRYD